MAVVPIQGGARLTGRLGRFSVGALDIQSDDEPLSGSQPTNFSVVRVKRDLLRRSSIGAMYTGRSIGPGGGGRNDTYGVDGTFAFFDNLAFNTYWARTPSRTLDANAGDDTSYRLQMDYAGDRYGVQMERLLVGDQFNPEVGFVRRADMLRHFGQVRFSPRPQSIKQVRKFVSTASIAPHREWRWPAGIAEPGRGVRHPDAEQRSIHGPLHQHLRVSPAAVPDRARRHPARRRLRLRQPARRLQLRKAAAGLGERVGRARHLLRRPQDDGRGQRRPAEFFPAAVGGADRVGQSGPICWRAHSRRRWSARASPTR